MITLIRWLGPVLLVLWAGPMALAQSCYSESYSASVPVAPFYADTPVYSAPQSAPPATEYRLVPVPKAQSAPQAQGCYSQSYSSSLPPSALLPPRTTRVLVSVVEPPPTVVFESLASWIEAGPTVGAVLRPHHGVPLRSKTKFVSKTRGGLFSARGSTVARYCGPGGCFP